MKNTVEKPSHKIYKLYFSSSLFLLVCSTFISSVCPAQCDDQVKPDDGIFHYKQRSGDERCEGTYIKYRSGENLRFVSFTIDSVYYTNNSSSKLEITVPVSTYHEPINVQGNNFNMNTQNSSLAYRLDMSLPEGLRRFIPLGDVINRISIDHDHLGFYGFVNRNNQQIFIPVSAAEQDPYNHSPIAWKKKDCLILLSSQIHLDEVSYSLFTQESNPQTVVSNEILAQNINPDQILRLRIPRKMLIDEIHDYVLKVKYKSGSVVNINPYYLFIP